MIKNYLFGIYFRYKVIIIIVLHILYFYIIIYHISYYTLLRLMY